MTIRETGLFELLGVQNLLGSLPIGIQQADKVANGQVVDRRTSGYPEIVQQERVKTNVEEERGKLGMVEWQIIDGDFSVNPRASIQGRPDASAAMRIWQSVWCVRSA